MYIKIVANAITMTILILYSAFRLEWKDILTWNIILCLLANNSMNTVNKENNQKQMSSAKEHNRSPSAPVNTNSPAAPSDITVKVFL